MSSSGSTSRGRATCSRGRKGSKGGRRSNQQATTSSEVIENIIDTVAASFSDTVPGFDSASHSQVSNTGQFESTFGPNMAAVDSPPLVDVSPSISNSPETTQAIAAAPVVIPPPPIVPIANLDMDNSVIVISDGEDDDDIVFVSSKVSTVATKRRRLNRGVPQVVDVPDSPTPPPPMVKLPVPLPVVTAPLPRLPPVPRAKVRKCPICVDTFDNIEEDPNRKLVSTKCGHIFCEQCLKDSHKINKTCPICRTKIPNLSKTHIHQIFL